MALIISVSGVRGIVGSELTPEVARRYAAAYRMGVAGPVGVGRDSRPSGAELSRAVIEGLGGDVVDFGIVPTPTLGLLVRDRKLAGGIQVTASHNPSPYNGLKLFAADGAVLDAAGGRAVEQRYHSNMVPPEGRTNVNLTSDDRAWLLHRDRVLQLIDAGPICARTFAVVLDANGGAGGTLGLALLEAFGCRVSQVGCVPDGNFVHEPEPLPKHLGGIEQLVKARPGAIGAVLDPDADRLVLIDETGTCLSEELTLALAVRERLVHDRGPVVINLSTSRATEDVAKAAGVVCHRSAVGEANVVAKMREVDALVGGEGNGGVIDPRVGWVRDPFIGIGLILSGMTRTGKSLHELAGELPRYVIRKDKYPLDRERLPALFTAIVGRWPEAHVDRADGLWLGWPTAWLHVRASNTEPIVRVIAEARSAAEASELCEQVKQLIQSAQSV
ncbi:MAG: phosphoglucosamine mutase [Gemmataceae bacterium]|nr:phosphoglucosamine mutase [Gemmataceae bacterium]